MSGQPIPKTHGPFLTTPRREFPFTPPPPPTTRAERRIGYLWQGVSWLELVGVLFLMSVPFMDNLSGGWWGFVKILGVGVNIVVLVPMFMGGRPCYYDDRLILR